MANGDLPANVWTNFASKNQIDDSDGNASECCLHLPLKKPLFKNGGLDTFMCVYLT
jgi:hypothetical protein